VFADPPSAVMPIMVGSTPGTVFPSVTITTPSGTGSVLRPGEMQRMTAGTGILHSEFNPSDREPTHLVQVWLMPEKRGLKPGYEQKAFPLDGRHNRLQLVASHDGRDESLSINQDADIYLANLQRPVTHPLQTGRHAWLQVLSGSMSLNGEKLSAGDAAAVSDEEELKLQPEGAAEVILFDLA
jgi:quercetin 2,3-dioxygenase